MTSDKKIGIAGFGLEGRAVYEYLKGTGEIYIFDENQPDLTGIDGSFINSLQIPEHIDVLYKSPGIPTSKIELLSKNTKLTTLMSDVLEKVGTQAIGITGTKGKSTVSSLIHHILTEAGKQSVLFGNIGVADMRLIEEAGKDIIFVMELSSYQCEHINNSPHIAVLLGIYPDHLTHHGSFEKYRDAKLHIAKFQSKQDIFVNASHEDVFFDGKVIKPDFSKKFKTKLIGEHNQKNCAVAFTAAKEYGVSEEIILKAIETFEPLEMRLQNLGVYNGITFYDDSLATIPEATLASIKTIGKVDTIILGGQNRNIPLEEFSEKLAKTPITNFIIFPETGEEMIKEVSDRNVVRVSSMEEAVRAAYTHTKEGGTVLLSSASKSPFIFRDFKDKSEQYRDWIHKMSNI